jgi:hypothetical protein
MSFRAQRGISLCAEADQSSSPIRGGKVEEGTRARFLSRDCGIGMTHGEPTYEFEVKSTTLEEREG